MLLCNFAWMKTYMLLTMTLFNALPPLEVAPELDDESGDDSRPASPLPTSAIVVYRYVHFVTFFTSPKSHKIACF